MTDIVVKIVTLLAAGVSVTLVYKQMRKAHEWNRRKASQDFAFEMLSGPRSALIKDMNLTYNVVLAHASPPTYESVLAAAATDKDKAALHHTIRGLLNHNETIAIGLKNHVLDEDMCYDHSSLVICRFWTWAQPYVATVRNSDPTIWIEQQHYATKWTSRSNEEIAGLRNPGKTPT